MTRLAIIAPMFTWPLAAQSQSNASVYVSINSRDHTQIEPGFAGYNVALMYVAFDYRYLRFGAEVRRLSPGWLRYPAGTRSEAFDWTTGASHQSWVDSASLSFSDDVRTDFREVLQSSMEVLAAKGGEHLDDAAALARNLDRKSVV